MLPSLIQKNRTVQESYIKYVVHVPSPLMSSPVRVQFTRPTDPSGNEARPDKRASMSACPSTSPTSWLWKEVALPDDAKIQRFIRFRRHGEDNRAGCGA